LLVNIIHPLNHLERLSSKLQESEKLRQKPRKSLRLNLLRLRNWIRFKAKTDIKSTYQTHVKFKKTLKTTSRNWKNRKSSLSTLWS